VLPPRNRTSHIQARGWCDVSVAERQHRGGRDPQAPVERGGGRQPDGQRVRHGERVHFRVFRPGGRGQRRSAFDNSRPRVGALLASALEPLRQRQPSGPPDVHVTSVRGTVGRTAVPSCAVCGRNVSTPLVCMRGADDPERPRGRGRPRRLGAGRERLRRPHPGLPILGNDV